MRRELKETHAELLERLRSALSRNESVVRRYEKACKDLDKANAELQRCQTNPDSAADAAKVPALQAEVAYYERQTEAMEAKFRDEEARAALSDAADFLPTVFNDAFEATVGRYMKILEPLGLEPAAARQVVGEMPRARAHRSRFYGISNGDLVAGIKQAIVMLEEIEQRYQKKTLDQLF